MAFKLLIMCTSIIFVVLQTQSKSVPSYTHDKRADNPCLNAPEDEVIPMESGNIICKSPSDEELEQKLKTHASGMNRHYFANSMYDARRNFKNLFEIYGKYLDNTTQWQDWVNDRPITSPYVDSVLVQSLQENAKRGVEVEKRGSGSVVIQCLPGGRLTAKGIHLCPACQRCTELPANYYPQYVNELTCDSSQSGNANQTSCYLTQYLPIGNCEQITMVFDVLVHQPGNYEITFQNATHTVYTAVYDVTPYEVRTCCECMVYSIYEFK